MSTLPDSDRSPAPLPPPTCFMQNYLYTFHSPTTGSPVDPQRQNQNGGLDPLIIQSFPTFTYSSVKEFRRETYGLECSICLLEFEDVDVLRLMTICCHVFHQECIDIWLVSHKTCPACRRPLDNVPPTATNNSLMHESINENDELSMADSYAITIKDDNDLQDQGEKSKTPTCNNRAYGTPILGRKFSRSNSTGHSIVNIETMPTYVEDDKFTLKLPEHVKAKLFRGHNLSQSCTSFGEYISKSMSGNGGFRELDDRSITPNNDL